MFRLPHSEISRVAHTEYIGVKPQPFVKVDKRSTFKALGTISGAWPEQTQPWPPLVDALRYW